MLYRHNIEWLGASYGSSELSVLADITSFYELHFSSIAKVLGVLVQLYSTGFD